MHCVSSVVPLAMTHQTFFEHTVLERHLRDDFLELAAFGPQILHLRARRLPHRVTAQLFLCQP